MFPIKWGAKELRISQPHDSFFDHSTLPCGPPPHLPPRPSAFVASGLWGTAGKARLGRWPKVWRFPWLCQFFFGSQPWYFREEPKTQRADVNRWLVHISKVKGIFGCINQGLSPGFRTVRWLMQDRDELLKGRGEYKPQVDGMENHDRHYKQFNTVGTQ